MDATINVLLIEDNCADARLIETMLEESKGAQFSLTWVDNLTKGLQYLRSHQPDVLLLDIGLPESQGIETLIHILAQEAAAPTLVVVSGLADEAIALQAVHQGAQDYLVKNQINSELLVRSIRYAVHRRHAEEALRRARDQIEITVMERTAELASTVDALQAEIAERIRAEERIRYMAHFDNLTGLPDRALLQDRIRQAIIQAQRHGRQTAVLFVDLDHFKHVNDSLGHHVGDRLLQMVAERLQGCLREGDSVARLGGDEFVLSLSSISNSHGAAVVAQKVLQTLNHTFSINGYELPVSCSIGISIFPDNGTDVETLMRAADAAMYHAKESGRRAFRFFTPALNKVAQHRLVMENRLRQALKGREFTLHYQPQIDMVTGRILAVEALLRWQRNGMKTIPCSEFITLAEETGLILPIGDWVLRQACRQLKQWHIAGFSELRVAVNVSPRQFIQPNFAEAVLRVIEEEGLSPVSLNLEITESLLLHAGEEVVAAFEQLRHHGVELSLDDFGTGYASLAYLLRFPVQAIKIDKSFVSDVCTNPAARKLINAIIALAHNLDIQVVAEGVETSEQMAFMLEHGCVAAQGFYYSQAVPADTLGAMLHN